MKRRKYIKIEKNQQRCCEKTQDEKLVYVKFEM